jgi:hypothetical protein
MAPGPYSLIDDKIRLFKIDRETINWNHLFDRDIAADIFVSFKRIIRAAPNDDGVSVGDFDVSFCSRRAYNDNVSIYVFINNKGILTAFSEDSEMYKHAELIYEG